jgi:segregation and condensation protein A
MLPGEEVEELDELQPGEAAEELVERMLQYARFRGAGAHLAERHAYGQAFLLRSARLPEGLRKVPVASAQAAYDPAVLGASLGALLRVPAPIDLTHMATARVTVGERLQILRDLLRRGRFSFDEAVKDADRATVCVTVWALLELYKRGEAAWEQDEPFGPIMVTADAPQRAAA